MQFERPAQQRIPSPGIPQDSFLPSSRISSVLEARNRSPSIKKDGEDGAGHKWSKVNGSWAIAKTVDVVKNVNTNHLEKQVKDLLRRDLSARSFIEQQPRQSTKKTRFAIQEKPQSWEFGKRKTFDRPSNNKKNNAAAVTIQRMARGWWQRLKFRVALLQHKLDTRDERTKAALANVRDQLEARKQRCIDKMRARKEARAAQTTLEDDLTEECRQVIDFLRKDNKKIRIMNEKLYRDIKELSNLNDRLQEVCKQTAEDFATLNDHAKHLMETKAKLLGAIPEYRDAVRKLEHACDIRHQYGSAEQKVKVGYMKTVGCIVEMVEKRCKDSLLTEEVVKYCLETKVNGDDEASS